MESLSAWYGGDPQELTRLYGGDVPVNGRSQKNMLSRVYDWLWGQVDPAQLDDKVHLPVAQDIAQMSADLLFAEAPRFVVQPVLFDVDGNVPVEHRRVVDATQRRLDEILEECGMDALLLAAAETASPLGCVGLRISYDKATMSMPAITRIDGDALVPEYVFGQLVAVTFWRVLGGNNDTRWVHLERHEPGRVLHGLYKGIRGNLGRRMPLAERPETAALAGLVNDEGALLMIPGRMSATSVPNMLPDPIDRQNNAGRSDYSPGALTLFDMIDKTMTSLMRDIEDGRSRLVVAEYMLDSKGVGRGVEFDKDQHMFTPLKMSPGENGDPPITQVQFAIRVDEHLRTLDYLIKKVVESCGYTPDTESGSTGGDMTATEYSGRNKKSLSTRKKKLRYWQALHALLETLLYVDRDVFASGVLPLPVRMEVPPPTQTSPKILAETVEIIARAKAASIEVLVRMLHPDWEDPAVLEEVAAIKGENSLASPDMVPGDPGLPGDLMSQALAPVEGDLVDVAPSA